MDFIRFLYTWVRHMSFCTTNFVMYFYLLLLLHKNMYVYRHTGGRHLNYRNRTVSVDVLYYSDRRQNEPNRSMSRPVCLTVVLLQSTNNSSLGI